MPDESQKKIRISFINFTTDDFSDEHNIFENTSPDIETVEFVLCSFDFLPPNLINNAPFYNSLKKFHFINNIIDTSTFPETFFANCPNLVDVQISVSDIYSLPPNLFQHNHKLVRIHLSHNKLTHIHANFFGAKSPYLSYINLTCNPITYLSNVLFETEDEDEDEDENENEAERKPGVPLIESEHSAIIRKIYFEQMAWKRRRNIVLSLYDFA